MAASPLKAHHVRMFNYHLWAHKRLHASVMRLSADVLSKDLGLPFASVQGTMNHMLMADALWYMRMTGATTYPGALMSYGELEKFWSAPSTAWTSVLPATEFITHQQAMCDRWMELVDGLNDSQLQESFSYRSTSGRAMSNVRSPILDHIVNHSTHHRGQVSTAVSQQGQPYPVLDLLYFLSDKA